MCSRAAFFLSEFFIFFTVELSVSFDVFLRPPIDSFPWKSLILVSRFIIQISLTLWYF